MHDGTTILFGLPGVAVGEVGCVGGSRLVCVVTGDPSAAACPGCGVFATVVRQRRVTRPWEVGYGEELLAVRRHKRQYACAGPACPRKAFTDTIAGLPAGAVEGGASVAAAVRAHGLGWPVVHVASAAGPPRR